MKPRERDCMKEDFADTALLFITLFVVIGLVIALANLVFWFL